MPEEPTPTNEPTPTDTPTEPTPTETPAAPALGPKPTAPAAPSAPAAPAEPAPAAPEDWRSNIPEDIRKEAVFANVKDVGDLAKQFFNAQKMVGREKLPVPKGPDDIEAHEMIFNALGRPEAPDKYPEVDLPEGVSFDNDALKSFQETFHKAGISESQYQKVLSQYGDYVNGMQTQMREQTEQQIGEGLSNLQREWGSEYDTRLKIANEGFESLQDPSLRQMFADNPVLSNHPSVLKMFYNYGRATASAEFLEGDAVPPSSTAHMEQKISDFEQRYSEALFQKNHPEHDRRVKERFEMYKKAYPSS
jgi:hypothetical protein